MHLTLCQRVVGCQLRGRADSYTRMGRGSGPWSSTTTQSRSARLWRRHLLRHVQGRFSASNCIATGYNTVVKTIHVTRTGDAITMGVTSAVWALAARTGHPALPIGKPFLPSAEHVKDDRFLAVVPADKGAKETLLTRGSRKALTLSWL